MHSRQFCSVCKQYLDMEVVQTADGEDDGVVWFRCPQCQGFLPKLSSAIAAATDAPGGIEAAPAETGLADDVDDEALVDEKPGLEGDDPDEPGDLDDEADDDTDDDSPDPAGASKAEPVHEYAAMLAAMDPAAALPYRPWENYEVGQCILHLAWNDCGVVVAKEALPGGRRVVKCWFQGAGVVRLIENAPR